MIVSTRIAARARTSVAHFTALLLVAAVLGAVSAGPAPGVVPIVTWTKTFVPDVITSGGVSTLTFTITNTDEVEHTDLEFNDPLPVGVVVAMPANAATTCIEGSVNADEGGDMVGYSGGWFPLLMLARSLLM